MTTVKLAMILAELSKDNNYVDGKSIVSTLIGAAIIAIGGFLVRELRKLNNKLEMINKHDGELKELTETVNNHKHRILNLEAPHLGDFHERFKTPVL